MKHRENNKSSTKIAIKPTTVLEIRGGSEASPAEKKLRREISKKRIKMKLAMRSNNGGRRNNNGEGPSMELINVPITLNLFPDPLELKLAPPPRPLEITKGKEVAIVSMKEDETEAAEKKIIGGDDEDQCELSLKLCLP